jgi:hypothetical protein
MTHYPADKRRAQATNDMTIFAVAWPARSVLAICSKRSDGVEFREDLTPLSSTP